MSFQSTVRDDMAHAIVGEIIFCQPQRVKSLVVDSAGATPNTVGKAYTYQAASDTKCQAGGTGVFAGILVLPKTYVNYGTAGDALAASLDLPDETNGELLTMGTIAVNLTAIGTGAIGEGIYYVDATGELQSGTAGAGQTQIPDAQIVRKNLDAPGLAFITLTGA